MEIVSDEEGIAIDAIPLATKPPSIVDWKIIKEGKIGNYQIIRADGSSKRYSSIIQMLKNFDREDLETLWKLVKAKNGSTRPEEGYKRVLWGDLKIITFYEVGIYAYLYDGRKEISTYTATITGMLNRKLQVTTADRVTTAERLQLLKDKDYLEIKITYKDKILISFVMLAIGTKIGLLPPKLGTGRYNAKEKVTLEDLFFLHSMDRGDIVDVPWNEAKRVTLGQDTTLLNVDKLVELGICRFNGLGQGELVDDKLNDSVDEVAVAKARRAQDKQGGEDVEASMLWFTQDHRFDHVDSNRLISSGSKIKIEALVVIVYRDDETLIKVQNKKLSLNDRMVSTIDIRASWISI
ncbi:hypothetical protein Tco_0285541 [Tanacetum coccineum]